VVATATGGNVDLGHWRVGHVPWTLVKNDNAGWMPQLLDRKIDHLASVMAAMHTGQGLDLLDVCEIETAWSSTNSAKGECRIACKTPQSAGFTRIGTRCDPEGMTVPMVVGPKSSAG